MGHYLVNIHTCPVCGSDRQVFQYKDWQDNAFVKCLDCDLVFQNPRNVTDYEEDYWGEALDPDGNKRVLVNEREHKIKNLYGDELKYINGKIGGGRILDVGCGFGFFLSALEGNWEKFGIELSNYCVDFIQKTYPDINIQQRMVEDNTFDDGFFDVIYNFSFIEHIYEPPKVFKQINRILKDGGDLIMQTPNIDSFVAKRFKGNYRLLGTPHTIMWSPKTLTAFLKKYGFDVYKIRYPFFKTDFFTVKNVLRLWDTTKVSPAFYGNMMCVYAKKTGAASE